MVSMAREKQSREALAASLNLPIIETGKDFFPIGKPATRRSQRYGKLVRGWDWRTTPSLLEKAEAKRKELNLSRTEFLEKAINQLLEEKINE